MSLSKVAQRYSVSERGPAGVLPSIQTNTVGFRPSKLFN